MDPDEDRHDVTLRRSQLSFLCWIKEELKHLYGEDLFPARYAETVPCAARRARRIRGRDGVGQQLVRQALHAGAVDLRQRAGSSLVGAPAVPAHWPGPGRAPPA